MDLLSGLGFAIALLARPSISTATTYVIDARFTDGGTLTGYFDINTYGQLGDFNLQSSANWAFAGFDFVPGDGNLSGGASGSKATFFGPTYDGDQLVLYTQEPLNSASASPLLSTSFECQNSYSCPASGDVRYIATPEPAGWATMIVGLAGVGASLRTRKGKALA